jgi:(1->4)-alpha-D-glucan 1-alpha-D-glucosylmutase
VRERIAAIERARTAPGGRMTPRATLRVQLHAGFTFDDAAAHADYFARLGVSHLYLSPITTAEPGSLHGYDTVDHRAISASSAAKPARATGRGALRARPRRHRRHRAEPHGRRRRIEPLVERRARMGAGEPLRALLRHRLASARCGARRQGAVALPRRAGGDALAAGDITLDVDPQTGRSSSHAGRTLLVAAATYAEILRIANRADLNALAERFAAAAARQRAARAGARGIARLRGRARRACVRCGAARRRSAARALARLPAPSARRPAPSARVAHRRR